MKQEYLFDEEDLQEMEAALDAEFRNGFWAGVIVTVLVMTVVLAISMVIW